MNTARRLTAILICITMLLAVPIGCANKNKPSDAVSTADLEVNNMDITNSARGLTPQKIAFTAPEGEQLLPVIDFSACLLGLCYSSEGNTLIAPLSVYIALAMTQNGASGDTLAQMLDIMGVQQEQEQLNSMLGYYLQTLSEDEQLHSAQSLWLTSDRSLFQAEPSFLQTAADYYNAQVYEAAFDDSTKAAINSWVSENTNGMIESIVDKTPPDAIMYLVNALAFEAEWTSPYSEHAVTDGVFTNISGERQSVQLMYSEENEYISSERAVGFIKPYKDGRYSFMAVLPNEDITINDYMAQLDGSELAALLQSRTHASVHGALPVFSFDASYELSEALCNMGMKLPFDDTRANFSAMGVCPNGEVISIERVLHKTFISVDTLGTKAGAATAVEMVARTAIRESYTVTLDRPFMFAIIDEQLGIPVFIGTVVRV